MPDPETQVDPQAAIDPQAVNSPYNGGNDEQMLHRFDGAFATPEQVAYVRRGSINEPTPLVTVNADGEPELYNPVRIEAMQLPDRPEIEPPPPPEEPAP